MHINSECYSQSGIIFYSTRKYLPKFLLTSYIIYTSFFNYAILTGEDATVLIAINKFANFQDI